MSNAALIEQELKGIIHICPKEIDTKGCETITYDKIEYYNKLVIGNVYNGSVYRVAWELLKYLDFDNPRTLPPREKFSRQLDISKITCIKALNALSDDNFIISTNSQGMEGLGYPRYNGTFCLNKSFNK